MKKFKWVQMLHHLKYTARLHKIECMVQLAQLPEIHEGNIRQSMGSQLQIQYQYQLRTRVNSKVLCNKVSSTKKCDDIW